MSIILGQNQLVNFADYDCQLEPYIDKIWNKKSKMLRKWSKTRFYLAIFLDRSSPSPCSGPYLAGSCTPKRILYSKEFSVRKNV